MSAIPIVFIGLVQGWLLYGLHASITHKAWPATDLRWLLALYAAVVLVALLLELLSTHLRTRLPWLAAGVIALVAAALGGYSGWTAGSVDAIDFPLLAGLYGSLGAAWFIALPFLQSRLRSGSWRAQYTDLFEFSWQSALLLGESALFTGVSWVLLALWAALFNVLGVRFFSDLFTDPAFAYPVVATVFAYAGFLIRTHESIVVALRRQVLGVFGWLLPLVAFIAVLFLAALPFTGLQPLWDTGRASTLMLSLQVVFIFFLNAAYQDGRGKARHPRWLETAMRLSVFSLPVYAALCAYSLGLRVEQYGWTIARVWAALGVFLAALYAIGYALVAVPRSPWMGRMGKANVALAPVCALVVLLAASPVLDPKRLSADSQLARALSGATAATRVDYSYLRFNLGRYGNDALAQLASKGSPEVAQLATAALARKTRHAPDIAPSAELLATRIDLYPLGTPVDPAFLAYLESALRESGYKHPACLRTQGQRCMMVSADLDGDGRQEIATLHDHPQAVYALRDGQWSRVGQLVGGSEGPRSYSRGQLEGMLKESQFKMQAHAWRDLRVGPIQFLVQPYD